MLAIKNSELWVSTSEWTEQVGRTSRQKRRLSRFSHDTELRRKFNVAIGWKDDFPSKICIQFSDHFKPCDLKRDNTSELVHELVRGASPHRRTALCHSCLYIPSRGLNHLYENIEAVR